MLIWFLPLFLVVLMLGLPVVFALLVAPGAMLWADGSTRDLAIMYRNVFNGMDVFLLVALPFFMLAGEIMNRGGITERIIEFSQAFMGHLRGGLAQVNILSSILFAGLSGSAVADTSALGSTLIPAMEREGYTRRFAAAITAASSVIGPIIPPSGIMIIYASVMEQSVAALFLAGIVPGVLVGVGLMLMVRLLADRYDLPQAKRVVAKAAPMRPAERTASWVIARAVLGGLIALALAPLAARAGLSAPWWALWAAGAALAHLLLALWKRRITEDFRMVCKRAAAPLLTPIIILGGILGGVFTPTEASAIAVAYALVVAFFILNSMTLADLPGVLARSAMASAAVLLLVGAAVAFKSVVSLSQAPQIMTAFILTLSENPLILLFLINLLLFVVGMFLDAGPAIIILGPILGPVFVELGVDPVHFAIIMSVNLTVGLATPPMGLVLFVASTVSGEKVETISKAILPFLAIEVLVIFLITYVPAISLTVPRLAGFL